MSAARACCGERSDLAGTYGLLTRRTPYRHGDLGRRRRTEGQQYVHGGRGLRRECLGLVSDPPRAISARLGTSKAMRSQKTSMAMGEDFADVLVLFKYIDSPAVQNNPSDIDFNATESQT